ncbi:uncharacterized protein ACA1_158930 [Acanthamoeba castellanii str. Neff]|uniref:Uncharacterized protein n=1 Tax=Acanthamoeba castellanii (strain ATCC 30010 / Neff) TaxID=1257118 RepID=L8HA57_ACACF|nr:uncharacterized protein ACA1_158930 [Acanthamoeba castellanii str. Neff]ELR22097.1 hypothetical protein ACA1_158930 [Acanthamoeba castellanii str. Neff]
MFEYWLAHENAVFINHIYMFLVASFTIGSIIYMRNTAHKQQPGMHKDASPRFMGLVALFFGLFICFGYFFVYMSGLGLWALPIMYVLAMCSASAIIYPIDQALMKGAFVKWVKYSGNQVTKSILPIYSTHHT